MPPITQRFLLLACLSLAACAHQPSTVTPRSVSTFDLVLENGQVIDGTGGAAFPGDGVVIGWEARASGHKVQRGMLETAVVRIAAGSTIGIGSVIGIGTEIGSHTGIGTLSIVPNFSQLEANAVYAGAPVQRLHKSAPD